MRGSVSCEGESSIKLPRKHDQSSRYENERHSRKISNEDYRVITPGIPREFHNNLLLANFDRYLMIFIFLSTALLKSENYINILCIIFQFDIYDDTKFIVSENISTTNLIRNKFNTILSTLPHY